MKHPVSVAELLELHRLGELYVKWASNPVAMSEQDIDDLQRVSEDYGINGTSALFSFQRQFQHEFGLTAENMMSVTQVAKEVLELAQEHVQHEPKVITLTPREQLGRLLTDRYQGLEVDIDEAWPIAQHLGQDLQDFYRSYLSAAKKLWAPEAEWFDRKRQEIDADERNTAVLEAVREDYENDRENDAQQREEEIAGLRTALGNAMAQNNDWAAFETLKGLREFGVLTAEEVVWHDNLCVEFSEKENRVGNASDSGTHKIPTGVLAEAVGGNHEKGSK